MSRSPKYTLAKALTDLRRALQDEREERQRHRAEAIERRRREVFESARSSVRQRHERLQQACRKLAGSTDAAGDQNLAQLRERVDRIGRDLDQAAGPEDLLQLGHGLGAAESDLARLTAAFATRSARQATETLAALAAALADLPSRTRSRFDPVGAAEVARVLDDLRRAASAGDAGFPELARAAGIQVGEHMRTVLSARARYEEDVARAAAEAEAVAERTRVLADDAQLARVPLDLRRAQEGVDLLRDLVADDPVEAVRLSRGLAARLDEAERELDGAIDRIAQRRQILASVVDVLPSLGLSVEQGSLTETSDGTVGIRAQRFGGDEVAVVVQEAEEDDAHRIFYLSEAMTAAESESQAVQARSCNTLMHLAEQVNASVRTGGFETGVVDWEGRNGRRLPPDRGVEVARNRAGWKERSVSS